MANYSTFVVIDYKKRKNILITSSARKAKKLLAIGFKIEIWNKNLLSDVVYTKTINKLNEYVQNEKDYIRTQQKHAEERNKRKCNR